MVRIARLGELSYTQIARDPGVSATCVSPRVRRAHIEDGKRLGTTASGAADLREAQVDPDLGAGEQGLASGRDQSGSRHPPEMMYPLSSI